MGKDNLMRDTLVKGPGPTGEGQPPDPWRRRQTFACLAIAIVISMSALIYGWYCSYGDIGPGPFEVNDAVGRALFSAGIGDHQTVVRYRISGIYGEVFDVCVTYEEGFFDWSPWYSRQVEEVGRGHRAAVTFDNLAASGGDVSGRDVPRIQFRGVYAAPGIRCYQRVGSPTLLFKVDPPGNWIRVESDDFRHLQTRYDPLLVPFAQAMFRTGDPLWVETFGEYLVRHGDTNAKTSLQRHAKGQFTQGEAEANAAAGLSAAQVRWTAQHILQAASFRLSADQVMGTRNGGA